MSELLKDAGCRAPNSLCMGTFVPPGKENETVTLTIDGKEVEVPYGTTILQAARKVGIRIPTLCHHDDLCVAGVCRICVVEIEGMKRLEASCS